MSLFLTNATLRGVHVDVNNNVTKYLISILEPVKRHNVMMNMYAI